VSEHRTFPSRPASVRAARHYAVDAIGAAPTSVVEAVAIAVSELATNSVLHAGTDFTVAVDRTPERLRIEVSDLGRGVPEMRAPDATESSGRGLLLVRELSDDWGVTASERQTGKSVWFEIRLTPSAGALQQADL
jgi:anti-sigma regulatory factor (Ser/Thr protein kinase)